MQILLLGATGRTGKWFLQLALDRGHTIHALVRSTQKVNITHPRLVLFEGDPLEKDRLIEAMHGCQAVISALNISRTSDFPWSKLRSPVDLLSTVMKNIIELAPAENIRRIIITSAWGVAETRMDIPGWFRWVIEHSNIRYPYEDHAVQEKLLASSLLDWTSVRPAGLTNSTKNKNVIVSVNNVPKPRLLISRKLVATFMLDILEKGLYVKERVVVSS